jgi:4-hydroxyphenylacetate 3-monooxygenase
VALRTGDEYRRALRDGREVYLDGRRVDDVTAEPGFRPVVDTFARIYDLQHSEEFRDVLTFQEDGRRYGGSWIVPRDRPELVWRRRLIETVARHTGGLFGRAPDYVPLFHLGMLDIKCDFSRGNPRFERNIEDYWRHAREHDLSLAHAFVDVQADPSVPVDETPVPKIVAHKEDGIVVRGAKTVATFTPYADEILIGSFMRAGIKDHHVMYFSIPSPPRACAWSPAASTARGRRSTIRRRCTGTRTTRS